MISIFTTKITLPNSITYHKGKVDRVIEEKLTEKGE
jgi:hypothetical protein